MLRYYLDRVSWIVGITFLTAFVLTFWRGRVISRLAAALYSVGTLVGNGFTIWAWVMVVWINFHLTDAPSVDYGALWIALILPAAVALYTLGAVILLWRGISQRKALRLGKILHLIVLPLFLLVMMAGSLFSRGGLAAPWASSFICALMWFRIRERYETERENCLPAVAS